MTYFYYSPKQAIHYSQTNRLGGTKSFYDNVARFCKVNYVLDGNKQIIFTMQGSTPPEQINTAQNWGDYQLVFQSPNPKVIYSQELW